MDRVLGDRVGDRAADRSGDQFAVDGVWNDDPVERYFACITTCSLDDGECITICTEQLRESH
ncbi:MAG: hypothetical protein FJ082_03740 [Cyanobacteria bacterium K_Offshore_surface_m2_011]|nr:hypothetical protein [Cyanobacteria bacterium K_Offshore_surface_m2_011]